MGKLEKKVSGVNLSGSREVEKGDWNFIWILAGITDPKGRYELP